MPARAAKMMKSILQYLKGEQSVKEKEYGTDLGKAYFSPFCRSPAPFLRIMQCLEHMTNAAPDTAYPADDRVLARTKASCCDSHVLICQELG
jgi:hypothetical protein